MIREQEALDYHSTGRKGKIEGVPTKPCVTQRALSLAYTPGVAVPCLKIHENPEDYYDHIYGEHEAGGTSVLYLAAVPFEQLGFNPKITTEAYPRYSVPFLYGVPVVLTLMPPLLLALSMATDRNKEEEVGNHD